jgi:hypothetical protein
MSTEDTLEIPLKEGFVGFYDPLRFDFWHESHAAELARKLGTNLLLRSFFISHTFSDFVEEDTLLREFIKTTHILSFVRFKKSGHGFLDIFFNDMQLQADEIFKTHLGMDFVNVYQKALNIGLFKPQSKLKGGKLTLVKYSDEEYDIKHTPAEYGLFSEITPALFEFWIKPEGKAGQMMELWTYWSLKDKLEDAGFQVYYDVTVHETYAPDEIDTTMDASGLVKQQQNLAPIQRCPEPLTDIDCLIMREDKVASFIECKASDLKWEDVLKFYGAIKLLNAPFGILISGGKGVNSHYDEFENIIKIFDNVINDASFPTELLNYLDAKLGIN